VGAVAFVPFTATKWIGTVPVLAETEGTCAMTSTSWSPFGRWYLWETWSAISCAAPRPPPFGCHVDHFAAGLIERVAKMVKPTIATTRIVPSAP